MGIVTRVVVAGSIAGVAGIFSSWLITGVLFHSFQRLTPNTWRPEEGAKQYAGASALTVLAAFVVSVFFAATGGVHAWSMAPGIANGLLFGLLCWAAFAFPVVLSVALFVNLHRGFVLGLVLDWLVVSLFAGAAAGWLIVR